jgi:hypothetical protein
MLVTYVVSLQGPEGLLLDLNGCNCHWREDVQDHFIIALWGSIFKREHNTRCHLLSCIPVTGSGLRIRESVKRLLGLKSTQELIDGPVILKENGLIFSFRAVDDSMLESLEELFISNWDLFPTSGPSKVIPSFQNSLKKF